jgi:hypothetical protein
MTRGEHLVHSISFALGKAQKVVRGLWLGLTDKERWDVARKTVEHLREHGDKWKLNEELESPAVEAHSTPGNFTEAHKSGTERPKRLPLFRRSASAIPQCANVTRRRFLDRQRFARA